MVGSASLESLQLQLEDEIKALTNQIADGGYKTFEEYKRAVGVRAGMLKAVGMIINRNAPPVKESRVMSKEEFAAGGGV